MSIYYCKYKESIKHYDTLYFLNIYRIIVQYNSLALLVGSAESVVNVI